MAYFDGKTQVQIAEELGIPLGTVKTRTLAAMRKLRVALGGGRMSLDHDAIDELLAGYVLQGSRARTPPRPTGCSSSTCPTASSAATRSTPSTP